MFSTRNRHGEAPLEKGALVCCLASLIVFGTNGAVASRIPLSSYEIVFFRALIGSAVLFSVWFFTARGKKPAALCRRDLLFVALSGLAMGASWMFLFEGYRQIGVGLTSLIYSCGPVLVMMLSPLLFGERLTVGKICGFAVVAVGIVFVNGGARAETLRPWGLFCAVASALTFALVILLNKQAKSVSGIRNAWIQLSFALVTLSAFVGIKQRFAFSVPPTAWPWILLIGVGNTGLGCYLYFSKMSRLPAQTVAVFSYTELVSSVFFSALLLHERLTVAQWIGAGCIVGGAVACERFGAGKNKTGKGEPNA